MTLKDIEKVINLAIGSFWEKNLEPYLNEMREELAGDIKRVEGKLENKIDGVDTKVGDLSLEIKALGRKLDSEVNYLIV